MQAQEAARQSLLSENAGRLNTALTPFGQLMSQNSAQPLASGLAGAGQSIANSYNQAQAANQQAALAKQAQKGQMLGGVGSLVGSIGGKMFTGGMGG
jgi:hypothetical protein